MKSNNKKASIRAVMAWIVSLLVILSSMMLVQNPASAQTDFSVTTTSTGTDISQGANTFQHVVEGSFNQDGTLTGISNEVTNLSGKAFYIKQMFVRVNGQEVWWHNQRGGTARADFIKVDAPGYKLQTAPLNIEVNKGDKVTVTYVLFGNGVRTKMSDLSATGQVAPSASEPSPVEPSPSETATEADNPSEKEVSQEGTAAPVAPTSEVPTSTADPVPNADANYAVTPVGTLTVGDTKIEKGNPSSLTTTFTQQANFEKAVFTVEAPNSILAVEEYKLNITQIEQGVKLEYKVVSFDKNKVVVEVYPVKDGKRVASAVVPEGSQITATGGFSANPIVKLFQLDIYGDLPKPELPEPKVVVDDYPYLPDAVENPPLQPRCGQNVAIVFDVSGSIGRDGLEAVKRAGIAVIDSLAGSTASVGLFNFSSNSPAVPAAEQKNPLSLDNAENMRMLKSKISNLTTVTPPGTNWEGALRSVKNSGAKYDAVFFVTDGMPSTNNARTATDIEGYWTHTKDLADAIEAANELKKEGTHIEAFPVKMPQVAEQYPEYLLKDGIYPTVNHGTKDRFRNGEYTVSPGQGFWLGQGIDIGRIKILRRGSTDVTRNQSLWTDGRLTPTQMIRQLLGPDQTDHNRWSTNPVNDWGKLAEQLRKNIAAPCVANLTIEKQIVDSSGKVLEKGIGWQFTAITSGNSIVTEYDASGNPKRFTNTQTLRTNGEGLVNYGVDSSKDLPVAVKETIPAGSNFTLHQQGGKNAKCTSPSDGSASLVEVPVANDGETGFKLKMSYEQKLGAVRSVHCIVQNVESTPPAPPKLKVTKLEYDPTSQGPKEIAGLKASFAIFGSDDAGNVDYSKSLLTLESGNTAVETELEAGTYWLVETKSPEGYQLLAQPVQLRLDFKDGKWVGEVVDGAGLVFMDSKAGNNEIWINVADIRTGELPKTGGFGVWLWALFGLLVVGVGGIVARRRTA